MWIYNRTYVLYPVVDFYYRDSVLCVVFTAIYRPSPWSPSYWLDQEWFTLGICWCHPINACPPPDLIIVCCFLCWLHAYPPSNVFVPDLVHYGLSCIFSETHNLYYCHHLPSLAGEGPVFNLVKHRLGEYRFYDMCLAGHADSF